MKLKKTSLVCGLLLTTLCGSAQAATTNTFYLHNVASGNWNSANRRMEDNYQVGYSYALPTRSASYFIVDMTPLTQWAAGSSNILSASLLVIGSTDFHMSTSWPGHTGFPWFKIGCTPQNTNYNTVSQIMTGDNIAGLWSNQIGSNSKDNGYAWVSNGLHPGVVTDCWHYEQVEGRGNRLAKACQAGGLFAVFQGPRFDDFSGGTTDGQNYIWGSTGFDPNNFLKITIWKP